MCGNSYLGFLLLIAVEASFYEQRLKFPSGMIQSTHRPYPLTFETKIRKRM